MDAKHSTQEDLFTGLHVLVEATFPKRCRTCGREYADMSEYIAATRQVRPDHTGLKQSLDDDGQPIVDLFRNCACGSTLLESFYNRRDLSEAGIKRRERFDDFLAKLIAAGVDPDIAGDELRKLMRGQPSAIFELVRSIRNK